MKTKLVRGEIPETAMQYILRALQTMRFGEVTLVAQDGILVQIERAEKVRLEELPAPAAARAGTALVNQAALAQHIRQEFGRLRFGRLVIVVKQGRVVQLERTEKQRFLGLDGEGI